jgi:hypothetical protein
LRANGGGYGDQNESRLADTTQSLAEGRGPGKEVARWNIIDTWLAACCDASHSHRRLKVPLKDSLWAGLRMPIRRIAGWLFRIREN